MIPVLTLPKSRWECPNCDAWLIGPTNRMHNCPGLANFSVYFVPAGTKCKVAAVEREDYVNGEDVRYDADHRPIMAVVTTRDDGEDRAVYAPCAHGGRDA